MIAGAVQSSLGDGEGAAVVQCPGMQHLEGSYEAQANNISLEDMLELLAMV